MAEINCVGYFNLVSSQACGSLNYRFVVIATRSEHLPHNSFGHFGLDYQGSAKACYILVWAYLPAKYKMEN